MIVVIAAVLVCLFEGIPLLKKGMRKEFLVICILLLVAVIIQTGYYFGITLSYVFNKLLMPVGKMFLKKF